jgi:hypothetical protein
LDILNTDDVAGFDVVVLVEPSDPGPSSEEATGHTGPGVASDVGVDGLTETLQVDLNSRAVSVG